MTTTVAGTFADRAAAQAAVERLRDAGIPISEISLIARQTERQAEPVVVEDAPATAGGATAGGILGALGGLLIGLGTLAIPGVGPVLAAGPLAAALGGAALGAATGGLLGALVDFGLPEEYATTYVSEVERGNLLLTVRTDPATAPIARDILAQSGALNVYPAAVPLS
jgi:uncharacterized membrane protein